MPKEKDLWAWLRDARKLLTGLHMVRIESKITIGFPDVEGWLGNSGGFTIELKNCIRPKHPSSQLIKFKVRPKQIDFLQDRAKAGGSAWLLVRVCGNPNALYLIPGNSVEFLEKENIGLIPINEQRLQDFAVRVDFPTPDRVILFAARNEFMEKHKKEFFI
jgi:hypothetical protein